AAGQTINYSFVVTNTGDVDLTNVSVTDTAFSGTGTPPSVSCPATTLAPNASMTCTATYTVTQADIDSGSITNTATATATPPNGSPVTSPPSTTTVTTSPTSPSAGLTVVKTATPTTVSWAGQTIDYSFVVTNTGNENLTNVAVTDTAFSGSGAPPAISCPSTTLAAGASMTCTSSYTVTKADIREGCITNTAVATGLTPGRQTVTSSPSSATVTVTAHVPSPRPTKHPVPPEHLPPTGAGSIPLAVTVGAVLLGVGGPLLIVSTRRRRRLRAAAEEGTE
ncbi:hypothetical protein ACIO5D_30170, partial [Kitasatospora sp. NPDC087315]